MTEIVHRLEQIGVVPMVAIERLDRALPLADALLAGGLPVAEITFRTDAAAEVTGRLHEQRPELLIGAGTVLNAAYLAQAGGGGSLRFGAGAGRIGGRRGGSASPTVLPRGHDPDPAACMYVTPHNNPYC